jgi:hypothetical protein
MSGTGYKLLGYAVWQGGKWYVRRRVPLRRLAVSGAVAAGGLIGAAVLARRLAG